MKTARTPQVDWAGEMALLNEMDRREAAAPLYTVPGYGEVRINCNPCDRRQFQIDGICTYILKMECEAKGKMYHGARYLTFKQAVTTLDKVARQMKRANPNYRPEVA